MHFQYRAMPFGLSSAPRTFTKLVAVIAASIRSHSIRLLCYLDDVLVLSLCPAQAVRDMEVVLRLFQAHGFSINHQKSHLVPTRRLQHLGTVIDTRLGQVFLSPDRIQDIRTMVGQVLSLRRVPLILLTQLLGKLISCISVGSQTCPSPPVAVASVPEGNEQHVAAANSVVATDSAIPQMVDVLSSSEGLRVSGAGTRCTDHRRQSAGLGGPSPQQRGPRSVVSNGAGEQHQLAGVEGCSPRLTSLRAPIGGPTCSCPDGQHHHQGPHKSRRGNSFQAPYARVRKAIGVGGDTYCVHCGGLYIRPLECHGGLAQQDAHRSCRVGSESSCLQDVGPALRAPSGGPVCLTPERPASPVLLPLPNCWSGRLRRSSQRVAPRSPVRLPSSSLTPTPGPEAVDGGCRALTDRSDVAAQALVCRPRGPVQFTPVAATGDCGSALPGRRHSSRPAVALLGRLALERLQLQRDRLSPGVINVIQQAWRASTTRIYEATWRAFARWCSAHHVDPTSAEIPDVLDFLHAGLAKGLAPATLRRQVAALSTVISCEAHRSLSHNLRVRSFLLGASNLSPPVVHRYPSWDLPLVLQALTSDPFEPLAAVSLKFLTLKVAFLLAITSARRVSELGALFVCKDLCVFHSDRVVLRLDPTFLTKVNSRFHRAQELVLPNFCPDPRNQQESLWHTLDVRRALRRYLKRTESFRQTESLLVSFTPTSMGRKVSSATISRWIKACISTAYDYQKRPRPSKIYAHSTRSAAASAAWSTNASVIDICRAASWSSLTSFIRHYKIAVYASSDAAFGRRVLQQVATIPDVVHSRPPSQGN